MSHIFVDILFVKIVYVLQWIFLWRQSAKVTELNTKVEGLENEKKWMDAKIKSHERDEEK